MAEALISPGVFLSENDQSQITAGPITVGAALVGPTVLGRVNIPTLITTYSEYKAKYGATFISGGTSYDYLTSQAALNPLTALVSSNTKKTGPIRKLKKIPRGIAVKMSWIINKI